MVAHDVGRTSVDEMGERRGDEEAEKRWEEACRREEAIRDLIGRNPDGLKGRDVSELAWELGLSRATTYRMIRLFRAAGTVTSLMDRTRARHGARRNHSTNHHELLSEADPPAVFETVPPGSS